MAGRCDRRWPARHGIHFRTEGRCADIVLVLVTASIANHQQGQKTHIRMILFLYVIGTLAAAMVGVAASFVSQYVDVGGCRDR